MFVIHTFVLVHKDGHSLAFGKCKYVLPNGIEAFPLEQGCFCSWSTVGHVGRGAGFRVGLVQIDGGRSSFMPGIASVIDAEIGRYTVEPSAESGLGAVGLARTVDTKEDLLGEFLRDGLVVREAEELSAGEILDAMKTLQPKST